MDFKNPQPKVSSFLPNVCDFQKENHTLGYGFKICGKSIALLMEIYSFPSPDMKTYVVVLADPDPWFF
jgi:hypothetical protein